MSKKSKKPKKKALPRLPKIRARIMRAWSEAVRTRDGFECIYCGKKKGEIKPNGKVVVIQAHHCLTRDAKGCPLRYDIRNGVSLCAEHHKFSNKISAHKSPIVFYEWMRHNKSEQYEFILSHSNALCDLDNRQVLEEIENRILEGLPLDLERIKAIEEEFPRKSEKKEKGGLLDEFSEETIDDSDDSDEPNDSSD